jgi:hypothetical protein
MTEDKLKRLDGINEAFHATDGTELSTLRDLW